MVPAASSPVAQELDSSDVAQISKWDREAGKAETSMNQGFVDMAMIQLLAEKQVPAPEPELEPEQTPVLVLRVETMPE